MLQQRFLITLFFSLAIFLIKFLLFFVQFSVHFLFFTCFFYYKKYCIFSIFYCFSPSHALDFVFSLFLFFGENFQLWSPSRDSRYSNKVRKPAKTWLRRGPDPELFTEHTGRWGFVVCVCFVYGL